MKYREGRVARYLPENGKLHFMMMSRDVRWGGICARAGGEGGKEGGENTGSVLVSNGRPVDDRTMLCRSIDRRCRLTGDACVPPIDSSARNSRKTNIPQFSLSPFPIREACRLLSHAFLTA